MTDKEFWKIIEASKAMTNCNYDRQTAALQEILVKNYSPHDIVLIKYFLDIYKINLHRWDLFVAFRLITKQSDEDYFLSFREYRNDDNFEITGIQGGEIKVGSSENCLPKYYFLMPSSAMIVR